MEQLNTLLGLYSPSDIFIFIIILMVSIKYIVDLFEWAYGKIKKYFSQIEIKNETVDDIKDEQKELNDYFNKLNEKIDMVIDKMGIINERLQENTKCYIIEKHHFFCYEVGSIDDLSLQHLETRYHFYEASGGNTYISKLMNEIRALPRSNGSWPYNNRGEEA